MDAKNSFHQSTAGFTAGLTASVDHEQAFSLLAGPPTWTTSAYPLPNNNQHHLSYQYPISSSPTPPLPISAHPLPPPSMVSPPPNDNRTSYARDKPRSDTGKKNTTKVRKPRKANNAAGGRSTLFWVHTDPQSVSEGTREETLKRIRSHVMSEHNRKKRLENTKRYKSKTWKHLAFQPVETTASSSAAPRATRTATFPAGSAQSPSFIHSSPPNSRATSFKSSPESSSSKQRQKQKQRQNVKVEQVEEEEEDEEDEEEEEWEEEEEEEEEEEIKREEFPYTGTGGHVVASDFLDDHYGAKTASQSQALTSLRTSSPVTFIGQGTMDPFNTMHTPLSGRMFRHLQHFLCNLTRMAYPLQRHYGAKLEEHWKSLVQRDPASLHACICVAATNSALETGEFPLTDPNKRQSSALLLDTFHHRGETIRLVNEGLSDPIKAASDELIAAVSVLLTVEIASGNPDYLKIHLAGLRQMVGLRNTFADVPFDVRFQISWTDIRVACMALSKPIFPFVRYARPKHFNATPPYDELQATASKLMSLIEIPGVFTDVMSGLIYDLTELVWYAEWIKSSSNFQDFDEETECFYNTEVLYLEYALHNDRYTPTGEVKGDANIEGCVRLACLLFHNSYIWDFYPQVAPVFPKPIIALQAAMESTIRAGCYHLCRDLMIWLLFVGACSSRVSYLRSYFVNELASAIRLQGIRSWQELRGMLFNFFYLDRCYLVPLRGLWDEIQTMTVPQQCINNI